MTIISANATDISTSKTSTYNKTENGTLIVNKGDETDKDLFLKLLVAQMTNQDPFNTQDPTQYITQLAQFNTLENLMDMNDGMDNLVSVGNGLLVNSAMGTASSLIGKNVEVFEEALNSNSSIKTYTGNVESVYIKDGIINMEVRLDESEELKSFAYETLLKISEKI